MLITWVSTDIWCLHTLLVTVLLLYLGTSWLYTRWIHLPSQYMPCMLSYHPNILECSPKRIHSWVQMLVYQYTRSYVHWLVFTRQLSGNTDTSYVSLSWRYPLDTPLLTQQMATLITTLIYIIITLLLKLISNYHSNPRYFRIRE